MRREWSMSKPEPFRPFVRVPSAHSRDLEVEIEYDSASIYLLIRAGACVVLVLIIWIQLDVLAQREQATRIKRGGAPFGVLAFIEGFSADVRCWVVGVNGNAALERQPVAITPGEAAIGPVKIGAISVGNQYLARDWEMKSDYGLQTVHRCLVW